MEAVPLSLFSSIHYYDDFHDHNSIIMILQVVIGKQYQNHNSRPGPVYAGGGYTPVNNVRTILRGDYNFHQQCDNDIIVS